MGKCKEEDTDKKKELTGDSGYDCNYCNEKNHLAKDYMLKRKKERENVVKDEAYSVANLEDFHKMKVTGTNLIVANDDK